MEVSSYDVFENAVYSNYDLFENTTLSFYINTLYHRTEYIKIYSWILFIKSHVLAKMTELLYLFF
jgi:hypothetical protein